MEDFDVVIRNGTIATASDIMQCDVGIKEGRVVPLAMTTAEEAQKAIEKLHGYSMDGRNITVSEARRFLAAGEFPPGSMGPKVEAAVDFVERGGIGAAITSLDRVAEAIAGRAGTQVVR